jgi:hypothetical protein
MKEEAMTTAVPGTSPAPDPAELRDASKILALAAGPALRPVDFLLAESQLTRDPAWVVRAFRDVAELDLAPAPAVRGTPLAWHVDAPTLEAIDAWRARAKFAFEAAGDVHARNAALLVYGWCIAAALVHFGVVRSSQPREEIDQLLAGIAAVMPEPYASLARRALHIDSAAVAHAG